MPLLRSKLFWLLCAVVALAAATAYWMVSTAEPRRLTILFDDVAGLRKGDPVIWKTFTIGKVEAIEPLVDNQIGVTVAIREEYAARIARGSTFVLKTAGLLGLVGKNAIEIRLPESPGGRYHQGEKIPGVRAESASLIEEGKQWTLERWNRLKDDMSAMLEESRSGSYRAEVEKALARIKGLAERGAGQVVHVGKVQQ